ncbi:MAG: Nuclease [Petrotoga mobilis]|nr:MAG: Nuclease [Petrotoga mobilis]
MNWEDCKKGRFFDLQKTPVKVFGREEYFTQGLLATNSKVTSEAIKYCRCVGLAVLSWDYPKGNALPDLIKKSKKHPLTCLTELSASDKRILLKEGFVFCQDLLDDLRWQKLIGKKSQRVLAQAQKMALQGEVLE